MLMRAAEWEEIFSEYDSGIFARTLPQNRVFAITRGADITAVCEHTPGELEFAKYEKRPYIGDDDETVVELDITAQDIEVEL